MATLTALSALALCTAHQPHTEVRAAPVNGSRPQSPATHVLFFLIDDLGYADVGYHGNPVGSAVVTPTIDALSAAGVRLEQCENMCTVCACAQKLHTLSARCTLESGFPCTFESRAEQ